MGEDLLLSFLINLVAGVVGILLVLWIERQRRPGLTLKIGTPGEIRADDPLRRPRAKWLHVQVHNRNVPPWLAWVYHGEPALACRAWITFHHLDGQRVFDREMGVRWAGSPEPSVESITTPDKKVARRLVGANDYFDIPPGDHTDLDVVVRINGEQECYGWNNLSYLHDWRQPEWKLGPGRYIAKIRVKTGGREYTASFIVVNDVGYDDFRLSEPLP